MFIFPDALILLENVSKKYLGEAEMGPEREAARALIDFYTMNTCSAFPKFEIIEKSIAIYEINHNRGVNKEAVIKVFDKMLNSRGENKFFRVHKRYGTAQNGIYELNF